MPQPADPTVLPWAPQTRRYEARVLWFWLGTVAVSSVDHLVRDDPSAFSRWLHFLLAAALVAELTRERGRRVVFDTTGIRIRDLVLERSIGWPVIEKVTARDDEVWIALRGRKPLAIPFDGRNGRPDPTSVAAAIEKLRLTPSITGAVISKRLSPLVWIVVAGWAVCGAVFLL